MVTVCLVKYRRVIVLSECIREWSHLENRPKIFSFPTSGDVESCIQAAIRLHHDHLHCESNFPMDEAHLKKDIRYNIATVFNLILDCCIINVLQYIRAALLQTRLYERILYLVMVVISPCRYGQGIAHAFVMCAQGLIEPRKLTRPN